MELSQRLKQERNRKGLSQQKLAELSGVHYSNIRRYEIGDAKPSAGILIPTSRVQEVSPDYLKKGILEDKAYSIVADQKLLNQFKKIE